MELSALCHRVCFQNIAVTLDVREEVSNSVTAWHKKKPSGQKKTPLHKNKNPQIQQRACPRTRRLNTSTHTHTHTHTFAHHVTVGLEKVLGGPEKPDKKTKKKWGGVRV